MLKLSFEDLRVDKELRRVEICILDCLSILANIFADALDEAVHELVLEDHLVVAYHKHVGGDVVEDGLFLALFLLAFLLLEKQLDFLSVQVVAVGLEEHNAE